MWASLANHGRFDLVLPLIRTLTDITLLRKGPESIPRATVLFVMVVGLWLFSSLAAVALIEEYDESDFFLGLLTGFVGVIAYALLVVGLGFAERVLQTISAILGTGALITFVFVAEFVLFMPFLGATTTGIIAQLILLWSVPVEGHIIARAIDQHWYVGIVLAIGVFVVQYLIYSLISTPA